MVSSAAVVSASGAAQPEKPIPSVTIRETTTTRAKILEIFIFPPLLEIYL
jgi:hypothetical protein